MIPEYDSSVFFQPVAKAKNEVVFRLKKMLPEFVFDDAKMEGNPFTFPEVKTVLDGITVGGHKISDHEQVVNLRNGYAYMVKLALAGNDRAFMSPESWIALNTLVVSGEAIEVGHFRTGKVGVAGVSKEVPEAEHLKGLFDEEIDYISRLKNPLEKAYLTAAWGMLNQFFWDGNKRTSRLVMNGILLSNGIDALTIPAADQLEYNKACLEVFNHNSAHHLFAFMMEKHERLGLVADQSKPIYEARVEDGDAEGVKL